MHIESKNKIMSEDKLHSKPFKLEDIKKKDVFTVPEDYFDKLPTIIQTRAIESTKKKTVLAPVGIMKLAIPVLLVVLISGYIGFKYINNPTRVDARIESMIADISTEELVTYLGESDLTSDELLDMVSFEGESLEEFAPQIDEVSDEDLELLLMDDIDFGNKNSI